jgi:hypothetical protein
VKRIGSHIIKTWLLIVVACSVLDLQALQIEGEESQIFLVFEGGALSWHGWHRQSSSNQEETSQHTVHPFLIKRIARTFHLNLRSIYPARYIFVLAQTIGISSTPPGFSYSEQTHFYSFPTDSGIRIRKIPTPENTDEPPGFHPA